MPFPHHDLAWASVAAYLAAEVREGETVVAPDLFWVVLPVLHRYHDTWLRPDVDPDWLVVHKGEVADIEPGVLRRCLDRRPAVHANAVFVLFGPARITPLIELSGADAVHLDALRDRMREAEATPAGERPTSPAGPVLPDAGVIRHFGRLDLPGLRAAMDSFYDAGGYEYPTVRDQVYDAELDRHLLELVGLAPERRRVDLASGLGRTARGLGGADGLVLTDLSEVAMRRCRATWPTAVGWVVADAARLPIAGGAVDDVVFSDAFEHVFDPEAVIEEAARVLRPDGRLFVTANNADSLNQRINRALGHPAFVTNYQHITEIAFDDLVAMLARHGFEVIESRGLFLFPYWGVPGVDEHVRAVTDDDPEIVEVSRELGELAGARHAFVSVVLARKVDRRTPDAP